MKRILTAALLIVLFTLFSVPALGETQVVQLPDQELTVRVYGCAAVKRTPNTVIRSLSADRKVIWSSPAGIISGDIVGTATSVLKEYDAETDTLYVTNVKVTVLPRDKAINYTRDKTANSVAVEQYTTLNGYIFPVGMKYSWRLVYTYNGEEVPVTYSSSNPDVASIDQNGMVTMKSAGTTTLSAYCDQLQTGQTHPITVYSSNTGGNMYGFYEPDDPAASTKVYAKPDTSSRVLYTISRYNVLDQDGQEVDLVMHTLEKSADWCKVTSQLGTGYIPTSELRFTANNMYDAPALEQGKQIAEQPEDTVFRTYTVGGTVYGTDRECNLYPKPDKATDKILTIPVNATMTVLAEEGFFLKVKYQGKTGYVTLHSVSSKPKEEDPQRVLDLPATMYTYRKMELFSQWGGRGYLAQYDDIGTPVLVVSQVNENWVQVEVGSKKGYMYLKTLTSVMPEAITPVPEEEVPLNATMTVQTGNSGKLYMRSKPSTDGSILGKYSNGTQVKVIRIDGEWAAVLMNNQTGYMMAKFLQPISGEATQQPESESPAPSPTIKTVQTGNTNKLNLRQAPRSNAQVITRYPNGTQVQVINPLDATWDQVRIGSSTGYMMDRFLVAGAVESAPVQPEPSDTPEESTPSATRTMVVNTGNDGKLNLRSKKNARSTSIERYPNGTPVTVMEISGSWAKVKVEGRIGYMMTKFLAESYSPAEPSQPAAPQSDVTAPVSGIKTVRTGNDGKLNLRSKPGSGAKILGQYPNGTQVEIIDAMNTTWDLVRISGQTGYMMDRYLTN